jgi:hypothetical protein
MFNAPRDRWTCAAEVGCPIFCAAGLLFFPNGLMLVRLGVGEEGFGLVDEGGEHAGVEGGF